MFKFKFTKKFIYFSCDNCGVRHSVKNILGNLTCVARYLFYGSAKVRTRLFGPRNSHHSSTSKKLEIKCDFSFGN